MLAILKKVDAESLGPTPKFQVNIEIQLNRARVSRLSFHSYDYKLSIILFVIGLKTQVVVEGQIKFI